MRLFLIAILLLWPASAQAQAADQEAKTPGLLERLDRRTEEAPAPAAVPLPNASKQKPRKLPYQSYDQIPEEAIAEAENYFAECEANPHRAAHFDCECLSMRFLEERIKLGPIVDAVEVELKLSGECPNLPGAAGLGYTNCINAGISFFPRGHDPEEYCSCVGNAYAKLYAYSGRYPDSQLMMQIRTAAALSCTKQPPGVPPIVPAIP